MGGGMIGQARNRILSLLALVCLFSVFPVGIILAETPTDADQKIIETAVVKAKACGVNPVPVCEGRNGNKFIPAGYTFTIENDGLALQEGDMLINATNYAIFVKSVLVERGEYAVIENDQPRKGSCKIFND
jgi:hypothetical protein